MSFISSCLLKMTLMLVVVASIVVVFQALSLSCISCSTLCHHRYTKSQPFFVVIFSVLTFSIFFPFPFALNCAWVARNAHSALIIMYTDSARFCYNNNAAMRLWVRCDKIFSHCWRHLNDVEKSHRVNSLARKHGLICYRFSLVIQFHLAAYFVLFHSKDEGWGRGRGESEHQPNQLEHNKCAARKRKRRKLNL